MDWTILNTIENKSSIVDVLLNNRGITGAIETKEFLNPKKITEIYNEEFPVEFKKSVLDSAEFIKKWVSEKKPVMIYGDYDADGICSTAIMYKTLTETLGYKDTSYFIPNRFTHGYGLSNDAINEILKKHDGKKFLFITVDTGITAKKEIDILKSLGHTVIVTDHHQKPDEIPAADYLVWSDKVVGSGIAWILSRALGSHDQDNVVYAAIATITDLQPVLKINRAIVKWGLEILNSNPPVGIARLLQLAGKTVGKISTYDLGWVLGPRLNASGRLVEAEDALLLLLENESHNAQTLAEKLNSVNTVRQDKTLEMYELAEGFFTGEIPELIVSKHKDYHEGIIGLVASKLVQKYYRPSIVIAEGDEYAKGSARSIPGIDIISVLRKFEDYFEGLGGHPMAAGFTIKNEKIEEVAGLLTNHIKENYPKEIFTRKLRIDAEVPLSLVDVEFAETVSSLEPFGIGNEEPVFCSKNVGITGISTIGKENQHLSFRFYKEEAFIKGIWFGKGEKALDYKIGDKIDIAYTVSRNVFNGKVSVDLFVRDIVKK